MKRPQNLFEEIGSLAGVGPTRVEAFNDQLGIYRVVELVTHLPRRYEDRRAVTPVGQLRFKETALISGTVSDISSRPLRPHLTLNKAILSDPSGSIVVTFFNQNYILNRHTSGQTWTVYGTCEHFGKDRTFSIKEIDVSGGVAALGVGTIRPYYPATSATPQKYLRKLIRENIARLSEEAPVYEGMPSFSESLRMVHAPHTSVESETGRRRLAMDELVMIRLCVEKARRARPPITRPPFQKKVVLKVPYELTLEQKQIMGEITADLESGRPMRRLVEGDVGSGKTVLAILAAAHTAGRGLKTVFLAPTEILAEQHYLSWRNCLENAGLPVFLLRGSTPKKEKQAIYDAASQDGPAIFFGTHALLSEKMSVASLGLVVIDEQQRFGVVQRDAILKKGEVSGSTPDMLTLSATPIPRTLAMTLYGDLEISTLRSRLPGRTPVATLHLRESERKQMMPLIRSALSNKERVYIVYPLIESDEEETELRNAKAQHKKIREAFPEHGTALLTGATKSAEKEATMRKFRDGAVSILVATSVVEVGLDVPEATLMVIEHADRFGLAQLHQLRGRVGRGGRKGTCVLTTSDDVAEYAADRIKVLMEKEDGFQIAEEDLRLRGPGEILGEQQHGGSELRVARLGTDADLVKKAQDCAAEMLDRDPLLENQPFMREFIKTLEQAGAGLL